MNQQTAQGLAALGRGPDSMLVHMAPQEVAGLQALALKHGGSLTINPETGLPEAGFLSSILPMVLGAGLAATGIGAPMAAMLVGGGYGVAKGSLKEGLMAGLGAYGGAGLGASLAAAAPAATGAAAGSVVPSAPGLAEMSTASAQAANAGSPTLLNAAQQANTSLGSGFNAAFNPGATSAIYPPPPTQPMYLSQTGLTATPPPPINIGPPPPPSFERMGAGLKEVLSSGDNALAFAKDNAGTLGAVGLSTLAGMQPKALNAPAQGPGMVRPYTYSREKVPSAFQDVAGAPMSSRERRYFNDSYTALTPYKAPGPEYTAAEGGIVPFASGGPVEAMSDANAIGMNTGYPQAGIRTGAYATPDQQPISRDMLPYAGQPQFAKGGKIGGYIYDPVTQMYIKPSGEGATMVSPTGDASGASGSSGGDMQPVTDRQASYFDTESKEDRDTRMSGIDSLLGHIANFAIPGAGVPSVLANIAGAFGDQAKYGGYGGASFAEQNALQAAMSSPNTGVGIPGESAAVGEGIGGGDISGANADTPALAQGGISSLGDYSDGGRLLRGPGDGVSDNIPAMIGQKQQARLADGEFVVPARIVSELGNGSTEAGARQLYAMMDRVQKARKKTVGKDKVATNSKAAKLLPA